MTTTALVLSHDMLLGVVCVLAIVRGVGPGIALLRFIIGRLRG